jgi:hypothetical protein
VQSRAVRAIPFEKPVIDKVLSQAKKGDPIVENRPIVSGDNLVLKGSQLKGSETSVQLGPIEVTPADSDITSSQITVTIPAALEAGVQTVQVLQRVVLGSPPSGRRIVESNVVPFTLRPAIQHSSISGLQGSGNSPRSGSLDLTVVPAISELQQVRVLLNQVLPVSSPPAKTSLGYSFEMTPRLQSPPSAPPPPTNNISIPFKGIVAGTYLVRLEVDGAQSPVGTDNSGVYATPAVTIA